MTQEELDALMAGGLDEEKATEEVPLNDEDNLLEEESLQEENIDNSEEHENTKETHEYRASASMSWPPPPPTDDHKMVYQLDDVTKDSELKAGEVFDKLESINQFMMEARGSAEEVISLIDSNISLFKTLCVKFPNVKEFSKSLADNENMKNKVNGLVQSAESTEDEVMMTMEIMQYQDIHRQKIERVINVMRALSQYMSSLFDGKMDDKKRVSSAVHIHGDEDTDAIVSNDDIEALIASLGAK